MFWMINKDRKEKSGLGYLDIQGGCTACKYVARFLCVFKSECNAKKQTIRAVTK